MLQHSVTSPAGGDSVFSGAWSTDVSQVNPERDKISNFGENEIIGSKMSKILSFGSLNQVVFSI